MSFSQRVFFIGRYTIEILLNIIIIGIQFSFNPSPNITILQSAVYQCTVTDASDSDTVSILWRINGISSSNYDSFMKYIDSVDIQAYRIGTQNSTLVIPGYNTTLNGTRVDCIATGFVNKDEPYGNWSESVLYIQGMVWNGTFQNWSLLE